MNLKRMVTVGFMTLASLALVACSQTTAKDTKVSSSEASTSQKAPSNSEKQIKKDANIILNGILADESSGFTNLMGLSLRDWKTELTDAYVKEHASDYRPESDYTLELTEGTFQPSQILELFDKTRFKLMALIGKDYELVSVDDQGDQAVVTFKTRAIATRDLSNLVNAYKQSLVKDPEDWKKIEALAEQNPDVKKRVDLLNQFLFYYAFDRDFQDFGFTKPKEFHLTLTKSKDGRYQLKDKDFAQLRKDLFVDAASESGAETRRSKASSSKDEETSKSSASSSKK